MAATALANVGLAVSAATSLAMLGMLMLPASTSLTIDPTWGNCDVSWARPVTCAAADETAPPIPPAPALVATEARAEDAAEAADCWAVSRDGGGRKRGGC